MSSDLEGVEQEVTEEANEAKHGALRDRLINDEGEEDSVNAEQRDESQRGFRQPAHDGGKRQENQ